MGLNFKFETNIDMTILVSVNNYIPIRGDDPGDPGSIILHFIAPGTDIVREKFRVPDVLEDLLLPELEEEIREAAEAEIEAYYTSRDIEKYEELKE